MMRIINLLPLTAEGGHLTRRFDEQTLAAKIRPAFAQKDDKLLDKFFALWRNKK